MTYFSALRENMVVNQVAARGVRSENVLNAMREVPRELFVPSELAEFSYEDSPLSIAAGQTISQPYIVAFMIEALGWEEHAPYDGIVVTAGGPEVPESLQQQLKIGGCMVIPIGESRNFQELTRVTRVSETTFKSEDLAAVRFVPLVGAQGWPTTSRTSKKNRSDR